MPIPSCPALSVTLLRPTVSVILLSQHHVLGEREPAVNVKGKRMVPREPIICLCPSPDMVVPFPRNKYVTKLGRFIPLLEFNMEMVNA